MTGQPAIPPVSLIEAAAHALEAVTAFVQVRWSEEIGRECEQVAIAALDLLRDGLRAQREALNPPTAQDSTR